MNILILTSLGFEKSVKRIANFLEAENHSISISYGAVSELDVRKNNYHLIVCHNFGKRIQPEVINAVSGSIVNLHPSLLPQCRGLHPILWALATNTPLGVSIHFVDAGIDTGSLIAQAAVNLSYECETLRSCYRKVQTALENIFLEAWASHADWKNTAQRQESLGSYFGKRDYEKLKPLITNWDMPLQEFITRCSAANPWIKT